MVSDNYAGFLSTKRFTQAGAGIDVPVDRLHPKAHAFQRDLTRWALRKGRCALFAQTGLGKTLMELMFAREAARVGYRPLILAPLAVARQTVREGQKWGIPVTYARSQAQADAITITNYEMVEHFDAAAFGAIVLDESSILKDYSSVTRNRLIATFARTPMRLCASATPAPNDIAEIANHAEFLGAMTRVEMLATFFVHDDQGWRLRRHAHEPFWRWLASWGMTLRKPSDLGYPDDGYDLPPLAIEPVIVPSDYTPEGQLFGELHGVGDRARVRRATMDERVRAAVGLVAAEPDESWLVWCGLNDESAALAAAIPDALEITGNQSPDEKARRMEMFTDGQARVLVTKPSIAGHGMNWQHCARMVFVGLGDSFEEYYQAIRRCYRYGQARDVRVYIVLTDLEQAIYHNVLRKETDAERMGAELVRHVARFERAEIGKLDDQQGAYQPTQPMRIPDWLRSVA